MKKGTRILTGFLATFFCIIILILQITVILCFNLSGRLSQKATEKTIDNFNFSELVETQSEETNNFFEEASRTLDANGLTKDQSQALLESNLFKSILSPYAGEVAGYLFEGKTPKHITSEELVKTIDENFDEAASAAKITYTPEQRSKIMAAIKSDSDKIVQNIPAASEVFTDVDSDVFQAFRNLMSVQTKVILIVAILILIVIIALMRRSWNEWLMWSGVTTLISGVGILLLSFVFGIIFETVFKETTDFGSMLLAPLSSSLFSGISISGGITIVLGLAQIFAFIIIRIILKSKNAQTTVPPVGQIPTQSDVTVAN
ncbi:MAG: hypothetical protein K0R90_107 [Oscillospiraceae bacterium]|jgi:hypothetical protein|nr:hypothetical protein [Oscillospiraceae bacterium]